jgi:hypothetical protein
LCPCDCSQHYVHWIWCHRVHALLGCQFGVSGARYPPSMSIFPNYFSSFTNSATSMITIAMSVGMN